jgi:hypothetical protein
MAELLTRATGHGGGVRECARQLCEQRKIGSSAESVGKNDVINGLMENAASVEIRKKSGFPPPLGKVEPKHGATFPHFHRPYCDLSF